MPPLDYPLVQALKRRLPQAPIALNGGLTTWSTIETALAQVDGVMVGRAAYGDPALLLEVDRRLFGAPQALLSRFEAVEAYLPYVAARLAEGVPLHAMSRHMLGLFNTGQAPAPGAAIWRPRGASEARGSR